MLRNRYLDKIVDARTKYSLRHSGFWLTKTYYNIGDEHPILFKMEGGTGGKKSLYVCFSWLAIASGAFVFVEPAPVDVLITLLLVAGLLFSFLKVTKIVVKPLLFIWLLILASVASMFFATNDSRSWWYVLVTIYLSFSMVFYILLINTYEEEGLNTIVSAYTFAAAISALAGIYSYFSQAQFSSLLMGGQRINAFFKDPNVFGPFLLFIMIVSIYKIEISKKVRRILWLSIFLLMILGILLSFSRAAWGGSVVAVGTYFSLRILSVQSVSAKSRKALYIMMIVVLASIGVYFVINTPQVSKLFFERLQLQTYDVQRFATQRLAVSDALKYPLGIGPGQAEVRYSFSVHNLYYRVLVENGLLAFIILAFFLIISILRALKLVFKGASKYRWIYPIIAATLLGTLLNSYFIDTLHWRHFWLILALPWAFAFEEDEQKEKQPS